MFKLKNVSYHTILHNITLEIPKDKIVCIIGRSGSGKSTLLRLFNKMLNYDQGTIKYNNKEIAHMDAQDLRQDIVMLSQTATVFPGNIRDNLLIGQVLTKKELSDDTQLVSILKLVELDKQLDDTCTSLSGGEKQRLALARALILQPKVLLLDEPTSGLDTTSETDIILKLIDYAKHHHISLIMITHSKQVEQHANIIIELVAGHLKTIKEHTHE